MRALALLLAASCSHGATLVILDERPADPKAQPLAAPFPDGTNGTELVLGVLRAARAQEVAGISAFEIQVGSCVRAVAVPPVRAVAVPDAHETERIVVRARETAYTCKKRVEQQLVSPQSGIGDKKKLSEVEMQTTEDCSSVPVDHVVTRYRYEIDHGFVTPDFREVERSSGLRLALGPPACGRPAGNEVRAVFHASADRKPRAAAPAHDRAPEIIALAERAQAATDPAAATELAMRALAMLPAIDAVDGKLASAIAAAHYFTVEADVGRFLARPAPKGADAGWAAEVGAEIDRIAKRYERIGDLVRLPEAAPWLRRGGGQLARLHRKVAEWLDAIGQFPAADAARAKALDYERMAKD